MTYSHSVFCFDCKDTRMFLKKVSYRYDGTMLEWIYEGICNDCDQKYLFALRSENDDYYVFRCIYPEWYDDKGRLDIKNEEFSLFSPN